MTCEATHLSEILVDESGILDEKTDIRVEDRATPLRRSRQLCWLRLDSLESLRQLLLRDLIRLGLFREALHTFHESLHSDLLLADYAWRWWRRRYIFCAHQDYAILHELVLNSFGAVDTRNDRKRASVCVYMRVHEEFHYHYDRRVVYNKARSITTRLRTSLAVVVGNLLRTAGEFIFGWWYFTTTIVLVVVLVVMAGHIIQFLIDSARKYEGG